MKNFRRGFTLTEILLVSAMFAVISITVFNSFSNGFKLWALGQHLMVEGDIGIFLEKFDADLRQTVAISGIPFLGSTTQLSYPCIIWANTDQNSSRAKEAEGYQIGAVQYSFDPAQKKIFRRQAVYGQALKSLWSDPVEVASQIEDVSMQYYFTAEHGLEVKYQTDQGVPAGVLIDVQFEVDKQMRHMRRYFPVPVGGGI